MNDWIVANINNPNFSISDFSNIADMSIDNTQMLKREDYLKSDFIKNNPLFKNDEGQFSEDKFNQFYNKKLNEFQEFQTNNFPQEFELDMFDTDRTVDTKIRDINFFLGKGANPDRQKIGIEGINVWSEPEYTKQEIAQTSKIWDTEKEKYKDYSPNDKSLVNGVIGWVSSLFEDPLVMAQWEEEGEHVDPITGQIKKHAKGDYKLNDEGTYYYETLNGRSTIGKEVLSSMDTLTIDGQGINKYDFFDSDDIEKSVAGVITKNVVSLLPLFIGGPVATAYSSALIAREMAKSLPMLYGIATSLFGDYDTPKWMNTIAAVGEKFTGSTSQYAKEHTFSIENFGNLIADVALQWGQQKQIAKTINQLRGGKDYMKNAVEDAHKLYRAKLSTYGSQSAIDEADWMKSNLGQACLKKFLPQAEKAAKQSTQLGRDISLAYMAIISNSDVFDDMIQHGATRREAAAVALGSTLGMFAIGKTGLGEAFFDDATEESVKAARAVIKKEMRDAYKSFKDITKSNDTQANKILKYINTAAQKSKQLLGDYAEDIQYHTTNLYQKMGAEGLEEVSEELVADTSKAIYELAGKLGADTSVTDVGSWDNALERYSMSLIGGALGGGIFYGKEVWDGKSFKRDKSNEELATLIRNGHSGDLRDVLEKLKEKGKLGSTKLSAKDYEVSDDGKIIWLTTKDKNKSQNVAIADMINDKISALEAIINNNQVGLTDEQLFTQMVLSEDRFQKYQNVSHITNYYQDFNNVLNKLISAELELKNASRTKTGDVNGEIIGNEALNNLSLQEQQSRQEKLTVLQNNVEKLRNEKDLFLSGDTSLDYARKLNFLMDPQLHKEFLPLDSEQIWKKHFKDTPLNSATEEQLKKFITEILPEEQKKVYADKEKLTIAWDRFKQIEKNIVSDLGNLALNAPQFKQWSNNIQNLLVSGKLIPEEAKYIKWDDLIPGESEEEFNVRNSKIINPVTKLEESDIEFLTRRQNRQTVIDQINDQMDKDLVQNISQQLTAVGNNVDPIIERTIKKLLPRRVKDIINYKIGNMQVPNNVKTFLKQLNNDLSNSDEVIQAIENDQRSTLVRTLDNSIKNLQELQLYFSDGEEISGQDLFGDYIQEATVSEILQRGNDNFAELDEISQNKVIEALKPIEAIIGDANMTILVDERENIKRIVENVEEQSDIEEFANFQKNFKLQADQYISTIKNSIQQTLQSISGNAIFEFNKNLKNTIKNPVLELIKSFSGKTIDKNIVPKIEEILSIVEDKFENLDDVSSLQLDDVQLDALYKTKDILKMVDTYLYAASSTSTMNTPIGHNKMFNEFAKKNQELIKKWEELPEIDSDYLAMYKQQIAIYTRELDWWIELHNKNSINKRDQFEKTDSVFSKSLKESLQKAIDNKAFKLDIDDEKYDLLDGIGDIEPSTDDFISLYNLEKLIHDNFQKAIKKSNLSVEDFLTKSQLLEKIIPDFNGIQKQSVSKLTPLLTKDNLTNYDLLQHIAMTLTSDPAKFYSMVKSSINKNTNIAPITAQEYAAKLAVASTQQQFRDVIKYAFKKTGDTRYFSGNTTVINGVAGAGKTQAVIKYLKNLYESKQIIAAGPTKTQATTLGNALGVTTPLTISELFIKILGNKGYSELKQAHNDIKASGSIFSGDSKYFTAEFKDIIGEYKLKDDAPIVFNELADPPKLIVIDEATHLSALEAQVLDKYMNKVGGQLILVGDSNQRGYHNQVNGMDNIMEDSIFAVRTPKLIVSLRDNNIQKQANLEAVRSLQDVVNDNYNNMDDENWENYWPTAKNIMSKFNFKVYNNEEINGDLITGSLSPDIISKINKEGKTVGFIGDKNSSAAYSKLQEAGLGDKLTALTIDEMQGQEFDYVVIDTDFSNPESGLQVKDFLQNLYTLMSRGKEASILMDNGLSDIIGNNVIQQYKAKAPSLNDKINGVSAVDALRKKKLDILNSLNLSFTESEETKVSETKHDIIQDFVDPDTLNIDKDIIQSLKKEFESSIAQPLDKDGPEVVEDYINDSIFTIPSWGDVTYLGVQEGKEISKQGRDGKNRTAKPWIISIPKEGPLRNLQALREEGDEAFWYADKKLWQEQLYKLKSAVLFGYNLDETVLGSTDKIIPAFIRNKFSQTDWSNGIYELEIRSTDGEVLPLGGSMKKVGMNYKGKDYTANIVFKVKDKSGRECIFDIAGINNPETLSKNLETIKENINNKLTNPKITPEEKKKLNNILRTIDQEATQYANLFESWINKYNKEGKFSINVSSAIKPNKITWFTKRSTPQRLGGYINPDDLKGPGDLHNFRERNPGMVVSNVYTFTGNELDNIDQSIKGKAVVFVSSNMLLKPDQLIKQYIRQKTDPENNTAQVRMIPLGNYGMTLSQLYDEDFIKTFQNGDEERKPIKQNFLGIRMFTGMWNFRAALKQFNKALENWKTKNNYNPATVDRIIKAQQHIYDNKLSGEQLTNYLNSVNLTEQDIKNLESFNQEDLKNIPTFRLGYSKDGNGFHIQEYNLQNSTAYPGKTKANFIAIDPDKANQFDNLISNIMKSVFSEDRDSLGVRLLKEDNTGWNPDELIDLENTNHKRSLSGLLSFNNTVKSIEIKYKDKVVAYPEGQEWSAIPGLISSIIKTVTFYQYNPEQLSGSSQESATIYLHNKEGQDREIHLLKTQIGTWFDGEKPWLRTTKNSTNSAGKHPDRTLANMFDLMFHGTVEDIHKGNPQRVTGVFAPNGFLVNPDISRVKNSAGSNDIAQETIDGKAVFYKIDTPEGLFTVDVDMRSAGLGLSLKDLLNVKQKQQKQEDKKEKEEKKPEYPVLDELMEKANNQGEDFTEYEEVIEYWNNRYLSSVLASLIDDGEESLDKISYYEYKEGSDAKPLTLREYITGLTNDIIEKIKIDEGKIEVNTKNNGKLIYNPDSRQLEKEQTSSDNALLFSQKVTVDGKEMSLKSAINKVLSSDSLDIDSDIINQFIQEVNNIISQESVLSEDEIRSLLEELSENEDYDDILMYLENKQLDVYNKLFIEC